MHDKDWILQTKETRRTFTKSTWIPLRASNQESQGNFKEVGFSDEYFGCGSVAFPPNQLQTAKDLSWNSIGIGREITPYAYKDGHYSPIEQYEYNDKEPIGVNLVFDHPQPVVGGRKWILSPDLIVALRLIKDGNNWVRPEEDFIVVVRETFDDDGNHTSIEIKQEFLLDYLAARNLSLKLSYYRQRVENVENLESSPYQNLNSFQEQRDNGRYELLIRNLDDVYGGSWALFRTWRTDVDKEEDAPVMESESDENTSFETSQGIHTGYKGVRVEGEFWRDELIEPKGISSRIRGDISSTLPSFIVDTDGTRLVSSELNNEDIGRWLWFRSGIVNELLTHRGFSLHWCTAQTGIIKSTSGHQIHFGINSSDLITVYAYDIARLNSWEQHIWFGYNMVPDGKVSEELLQAQVEVKPASTHAVEDLLFMSMQLLESGFKKEYGIDLFIKDIDLNEFNKLICRFSSTDQASLLKLAKDLIRVFSERLNKSTLKELSNHKDKKKLGSNKLLESILAQEIGVDKAHKIFGVIAGVYDMRVGDAHPTSDKIKDALKLAEIDDGQSYLRQGEQLISNFGQAIWWIGKLLFT